MISRFEGLIVPAGKPNTSSAHARGSASADTELAHRLWNDHQARRRAAQMPKRPVADVLIAAVADRFQGIITRNAAHFRNIAPALTIVEP